MRNNLVIEVALILLVSGSAVLAQVPPSNLPTTMEERGPPASGNLPAVFDNFSPSELQQVESDLPSNQLSKFAHQQASEIGAATRSAKDAAIYRAAAPSVVLVLTKDSLGSGSLIDTTGDILTNAHVVNGFSTVWVVFKPSVEGKDFTRDDMRLGHVIKVDGIDDLALIRVDDFPRDRNPLRLGDASDISVGADVHAIGHPTGQAWTYTKGVISQYRLGFEWSGEDGRSKHKADIIQTQTPINPGNSGGPLLGDSGTLLGVNSFKNVDAEGLNFAISIDEVKRFLARQGNRPGEVARVKPDCKLKEVSRFRNEKNDANVIAYDLNCSGKVNANYVIPDKASEPIVMTLDRNGDGRPDVMFFDLQRRGKWDLSFWDEDFKGYWTLVGYHPDGGLEPSTVESYENYKKRLASR